MKKIEYHKNGVIRAVYNLDKNEEFHGRFMSFHENGNLDLVCRYDHGKQVGRKISYHSNGKLCRNAHSKTTNSKGV